MMLFFLFFCLLKNLFLSKNNSILINIRQIKYNEQFNILSHPVDSQQNHIELQT
jgi:hypothetical protein